MFRAALANMRGKPCWGFSGGHAPSLDFGGKTLAKRPLTNPHLSEDVRLYVAEFSLWATCPWELEENSVVICSRTDDPSPGGPISTGLARLVGRTVVDAWISPPSWSIEIRFTRSLTFRTRSYEEPMFDREELYDFFTPELVYGVITGGRIETEPRDFQ